MDTSEQYIKMCEKAEEIQSLWSPAIGDFYTHQQGATRIVVVRDVAYGRRLEFYRLGYSNRWGPPVWLPRQDQLQEMVLPDWNKKDAWGDPIEPDYKTDYVFWLVRDFADSIQERKWAKQTMEQLWLAFVMKKKYNKVWDGETWVGTQ